MAEILSSLVKPAMEELGRITLVKIKHLFTYLCFFNNNIQKLKDEAQKLEDARVGLQGRVEVDENNAQVILPEVTTWLKKASDKIQVDKSGIDNQIPTLKNGCWGVKSRFLLSMKAVKLTGEMKQLMEDHDKFNHISMPRPPPSQLSIPLGTTYDFQSRKQIEEEILEALRGKEVATMGICGMGGVGKTTMAKRIMDRVQKENIFQEIFMVVVSQQVDMSKIQGAIAESLGFKLDKETLLARATELLARLTSKNRILIVLDDVWEKLKLEDLGIPCGNEQCTILLTSRNKDVLEKMDVKNVYGVKILSDTEAWLLFREKTGSSIDDPNLLSTAEEVARECKCLPLALITVGGALKNQTNITVWKDALRQLKSFNPEDMEDVIKDVYNPLKLSYTYLGNKRAKSLFLLCSLFPEDYEISLEELTSYCMGLRMFPDLDYASEGILEEVRGRVSSIVYILKNRFLLLNGEDEHHVRMHDLVRDVAIYMAKDEAKEGIVDVKFNSMCLSSEYTYHWVSVFSKETSSLLRMHDSGRGESFGIKNFSIFKEINKPLNLLSFVDISLESIPLEIQLLKNLRTLRLQNCDLESFSVVGELFSLEILCCPYCYGITELPVEIGNLNRLKLLDFTYCRSLERIRPGVISNLVELEEFKMFDSFGGWELAGAAVEVQEQEGRNACLNEFEKLSKLTCLEIKIDDSNLTGEEIRFSPNIVRYRIRIGWLSFSYDDKSNSKGMYVQLPRDINWGSWVHRFLRSADGLYLQRDGLKRLDLWQAHNMKSLRIHDCFTDKELVNSSATSTDDLSKFDVFPILECLLLSNLPNLEEIYDGHLWKTRPNRNIVSFEKLRQIDIEKCNKLHNLFSFPTSIWTERVIDELLCTEKVFFPMLEYLNLVQLDKLEVIWSFPILEESSSYRNLRGLTLFKNLKNVRLLHLPAMTHLWKSPNLNVSLSNLSDVHIYKCPKLRSLFSCTMSMDFLPQLANLTIAMCEMMEQVLLNEENINDGNQCHTVKFSKLSTLELKDLKSLTAFGMGIETIEFPMLDGMTIDHCPKLVNLLSSNGNNQTPVDGHDNNTFHLFCNQKISFGSLKRIFISGSGICSHQVHAGFCTQIEELGFFSCSSIKSLFASSVAINLVNLKTLIIKECKEMKKLIEDDEDMAIESIVFPMLEEMKIKNCPKLMRLPPSTVNDKNSANNHDDDTFHLFCSKTISFGNLKRVSISTRSEGNIWCHQIPTGFFSQLEELEISICSGIRSLFSFSIAANLVNLKKLNIRRCDEMVKVVEDDEEMFCEKPPILFPNLKRLDLDELSKLKCFCNWKCDLQLPSLEEVEIHKCLLLEFFAMKSVSTPQLKSIRLDYYDRKVLNLNGAIKQHFEAYQDGLISIDEPCKTM